MAEQKKYLRACLSECRAAISGPSADTLGAEIQRRLLDSEYYRAARTLVLYSAKDKEVSTDRILADALVSGRAVFFPRFDHTSHTIAVARVSDRSELEPGAFGVMEPPATAATVAARALDGALICVPGVAFTIAGERLGRGGGHYDRFLGELSPEAITVGLAYSFQLLDRIPVELHDRQLNLIVTESALYRAPDAPQGARRIADQGGTPGWF